MRPLDTKEIETVHDWLRSLEMPVNRLLHRDYADGVLIAQLLKKLFPRHVELHNYQRGFSQNLKVINWRALESKVLKRLGIKLTMEEIETLARGDPGIIERLLYQIMKHTSNGKTLNTEPPKQQHQQQQPPIQSAPPKSKQKLASRNNQIKSKINSVRPKSAVVLLRRKSFHDHSDSDPNNLKNARSKVNSKKFGKATSTSNVNMATATEMALNEVRTKIKSLEEMLKKRENEIQLLMERERVTSTQSPELKKVLSAFKSKKQ